MANTCSVCIEEFTKQPSKKQAKCPYCDVQACVKCTQTYLVNSTEDPHCMGCRKGWGREVLDSLLLSTWVNGDYKKHRENVLLDRERSRLPAAQVIIENMKRAEEYEPERKRVEEKIQELGNELRILSNRLGTINYIQSNLRQGRDVTSTNKKDETRRVFTMPCPVTDCRGFLSQAYKCGICETFVCPQCHEIKGTTKDSEHTCNPDTVKTVNDIKKNTRNCPSCSSAIFKIEGCDQMYCTNCNTPFSWRTGEKITHGAIHNPHYYEFIRRSNNGIMPRQPGDIPCGANLPTAWQFDRDISRRYPQTNKVNQYLYIALQTLTHIQHAEIPHLVNHAEDLDNTECNVRYLRKEITEDRWKQLLQQREKRRQKRDDMRLRFEALVGVGVDVYRNIINQLPPNTQVSHQTATNHLENAQKQLLQMREIFNTSMLEISKRYKCRVMQLDENIRRTYTKYQVKRTSKETDSDSDDESVPKTNIVVNNTTA